MFESEALKRLHQALVRENNAWAELEAAMVETREAKREALRELLDEKERRDA